MRKWKVSIYALDDMGEHIPMNYVEKVEYILHPTFEHPERGNEKTFWELIMISLNDIQLNLL